MESFFTVRKSYGAETWEVIGKNGKVYLRNRESKEDAEGHAAEMNACPPCVTCGIPAGWSVDWLFPARVPDTRPVCSTECALKAKENKVSA